MNLAPVINTYLVVEAAEKQLLYYFERPSFTFPIREEMINGKKVLKQTAAVWTPIVIEVPTRILEGTQKWIDSKVGKTVTLSMLNNEGRLFEQWMMRDAVVKLNQIARSRVSDSDIIRLQVEYSWAQKMR